VRAPPLSLFLSLFLSFSLSLSFSLFLSLFSLIHTFSLSFSSLHLTRAHAKGHLWCGHCDRARVRTLSLSFSLSFSLCFSLSFSAYLAPAPPFPHVSMQTITCGVVNLTACARTLSVSFFLSLLSFSFFLSLTHTLSPSLARSLSLSLSLAQKHARKYTLSHARSIFHTYSLSRASTISTPNPIQRTGH